MKGEGQCSHHIVVKCWFPFFSSSVLHPALPPPVFSCLEKKLVKQFILFVIPEQWGKVGHWGRNPSEFSLLRYLQWGWISKNKKKRICLCFSSNKEDFWWSIWHNFNYCKLLHGVLCMCHHLFYKFFFFMYYAPPTFFIIKNKLFNWFLIKALEVMSPSIFKIIFFLTSKISAF